MEKKFRLLLLLVLLMTAATGAWAQEGTLLTTILSDDNTDFKSGSKTFDNKATVTFSGNVDNYVGWGWYSMEGEATLTVTAAEGYTITRVKFYTNSGSAFDEEAPFEAILVLDLGNYKVFTKVNDTSIGESGVTQIDVYGYAAPAGYTVSMKSGVKDAGKWTVKVGVGQAQALPIGGLKGDGSETVTLQYNGRLKVKGVKAVKKAKPAAVTYIGTKSPTEAKAVGDIVFSDGSATAYTSGLTLTDEQKAAAVAVIFYAGSASDILGAKTLGVGLKNTNDETTKYLAFARNASGTAEGYNTNITAIQCTPSESGDGKAATATFTGDLDGSDNWTALCAAVNDEGTSGNYPAWEWVNAYATTANLTGEYASGWYLPTVAELCMLYRAKDTVNAALEKADGTIIVDNYYWSSSQSSSTNNKAWMVKFDIGKLIDTYKGNKWYVCGVRAFN